MYEGERETKLTDRKNTVAELRRLLRQTQALPQVKSLSEKTIAEEIEKTRNQ